MKIQIEGWESQGFRCPDVNVSLLINGSPGKVALIQMPNGTGKTTTLKLIRASLTGSAEKWTGDEIRDLRSLTDESISVGKFILRLLVDSKKLVIETVVNFTGGNVRYKTSSPLLGGVVEGWQPPDQIKRFMAEKFVSLFIFDGEFAADLLDSRKAKATEAIDTLSQLDLFDFIKEQADARWEREEKHTSGKSKQFLAELRTKETKLKTRLSNLSVTKIDRSNKLIANQDRINELKKLLSEKINKNELLKIEQEQLLSKKSSAEIALNNTLDSFMNDLRYPQKLFEGFSHQLHNFKLSLDKAKLPDTSSRQFFTDLCDQEFCVCGRKIDVNERDHILNHAQNYLASDVSGILNAIKTDIDLYVQPIFNSDFITLKNCLEKSQEQYFIACTDIARFDNQAAKEKDDEYDKWKTEQIHLESECDEFRKILDLLDASYRPSDDEESYSIKSIDHQLREIQDKIAKVTDTVDLRDRLNTLREILLRAKELAKTELHEQLIAECNVRLQSVLSQSPIQIEGIDNHIKLLGQTSGSVGQTLAVAYVFLTAALHRGSHQFPLVVDSPAGSLEKLVRTEIGRVIPELCEQFISFIIDTEKDGFVPALEGSATNEICYITIFRVNKNSTKLLDSVPQTLKNVSGDSAIVIGKEFFTEFTLARE
jgi:DNA sulfur modification protein DndD